MSRCLYVGTMMASRPRGVVLDNQIKSFTVVANTLAEAMGYAYGEMERMFPSRQGYSYSGKLSAMTRAEVAAWLAAYDEQEPRS